MNNRCQPCTRIARVYGGSNEIMKEVIARAL
jgi:alkylation response protein AidB-like acyl-CoA dehydrogenase